MEYLVNDMYHFVNQNSVQMIKKFEWFNRFNYKKYIIFTGMAEEISVLLIV